MFLDAEKTRGQSLRRNGYSFTQTLDEGILVVVDELEELGIRSCHVGGEYTVLRRD
jgi:hypothetical protein